MNMHEQASETIAKYKMLTEGGHVCVGVSGGADSVALLYFLLSLRDNLGIAVTALHLNHSLRGDESQRDEAFVKSICEQLAVECVAETADVKKMAADKGLSLEEAGREARYAFFSRECTARGAKLATAHTLSDSVETVLLNLARGTALRGFCGIPPSRGYIIRPLIECERAQIEDYLKQRGLLHISDSSNDSDDFARNRLRKYAVPALKSVNGAFYANAIRAIDALRLDADYLDGEARRAFDEITEQNGRLNREKYLGLHRTIRMRILLLLLSRHGLQADYSRLTRLDGIAEAGGGAEQLSALIYFDSDRKSVGIKVQAEHTPSFSFSVTISDGPAVIDVFSDKILRLMHTECEYYEENIKYAKRLLKNALDCDRIDRIIEVRQKAPGDAIKLLGRGCSKTLKKLFQEAGILPFERERILVLSDSGGPVWVEGFGVAERAAISEKTRKMLILKVQSGGLSDVK